MTRGARVRTSRSSPTPNTQYPIPTTQFPTTQSPTQRPPPKLADSGIPRFNPCSNSGDLRCTKLRRDRQGARMHKRDIIVVGASMGGVDALSALVGRLPADLPASVLVVQHSSAESPG